MKETSPNWFECKTDKALAGTRYLFELDGGRRRPDPASQLQPDGVHGPSEVIDQDAFGWEDGGWANLPLEDYIFYELHVGTFTRDGTFEGVIKHIPYLKDLGVTAVELMPISQFPGSRNWGYDCVYPFSVHEGYGGPVGLKRLVNALHKEGLAVVLDVVYNHLGPEGNYLGSFGPYFTDKYQTPWGDAINFDGEGSGQVRDFFISNALFWAHHFHIDALRLDAVHGIFDQSPMHILKELNDSVRESTDMYLIAESDLNDPRVIEDTSVIDDTGAGGYGLDLQWNDDFHHALHTLLTSEDMGYYMDFGGTSHLLKALKEGFIYSGQYSAFRKQHHGRPTAHLDPCRFVVFSQNHDQVGNRAQGDRLSASLSNEQLRLAAALTLLTPSLPLLFMGEEYAEKCPFQYFVDHGDMALAKSVRESRKTEFPLEGKIPDPAAESTFLDSKLDHTLCSGGLHKDMLEYYRSLIALRKNLPALKRTTRQAVGVYGNNVEGCIVMTVWHEGQSLLYIMNLSSKRQGASLPDALMREMGNEALLLVDSATGRVEKHPEPAKIKGIMDIAPNSLMLFELEGRAV